MPNYELKKYCHLFYNMFRYLLFKVFSYDAFLRVVLNPFLLANRAYIYHLIGEKNLGRGSTCFSSLLEFLHKHFAKDNIISILKYKYRVTSLLKKGPSTNAGATNVAVETKLNQTNLKSSYRLLNT